MSWQDDGPDSPAVGDAVDAEDQRVLQGIIEQVGGGEPLPPQDVGFTQDQIKLLKGALDPRLLKTRKGGGNKDFSYIETYVAMAFMNVIFGPDGWWYRTIQEGVDHLYPDQEGRPIDQALLDEVDKINRNGDLVTPESLLYWKRSRTYRAWVEVGVRGKVNPNVDIGTCELRNSAPYFFQKNGQWTLVQGKDNLCDPDSVSTARKGAVSDGVKRSARALGRFMGLFIPDGTNTLFAMLNALDETGELPPDPRRPQQGRPPVAPAPAQRPQVAAPAQQRSSGVQNAPAARPAQAAAPAGEAAETATILVQLAEQAVLTGDTGEIAALQARAVKAANDRHITGAELKTILGILRGAAAPA